MSLLTPLSQILRLVRSAPAIPRGVNFSTSLVKNGGCLYREAPHGSKLWFGMDSEHLSLAIMTGVWWWIFHGVFTEPAHIFGFWDEYPEPEKWTDEQLGIPADDE